MRCQKLFEIVTLSTPVILLAGYGHFRSKQNEIHAAKVARLGPAQIEYHNPRQIPVDDFHRDEGFDACVDFAVEEVGKVVVPPGWRHVGIAPISTTNLRLVYKIDGKWHTILEDPNNPELFAGEIRNFEEFSTWVDLKKIPQTASEIRLRGKFSMIHWYQGPIPPGWKKPKNIEIDATDRAVTIESDPFDVLIER